MTATAAGSGGGVMKWRVDFADGGSLTVENDEALSAVKEASRIYDRGKRGHVRVLRAVVV